MPSLSTAAPHTHSSPGLSTPPPLEEHHVRPIHSSDLADVRAHGTAQLGGEGVEWDRQFAWRINWYCISLGLSSTGPREGLTQGPC
ncbi:hypothetical protein DPEC_G00350400 [Dallia pectoralis]|uniref:Uncharacterized protein n=1 Tax=Dallia pectoralis TaxID=75939 RepID=A0ACC2F1R8_DALPE|nr:hypothetical protein DPEC_G00350400 [Dallia pectoralis]